MLGIVQGWDPDYCGMQVNLMSQSTMTMGASNASGAPSDNCINVLIFHGPDRSHSIDLSSNGGEDKVGGGHTAGYNRSRSNTIESASSYSSQNFNLSDFYCGSTAHLVCISNVTTFIREFQALISVRYLSKSLQSIVISKSMGLSHDDSSRGTAAAVVMNGAVACSTKALPSKSSGQAQQVCPPNVPRPLWNALVSEYNDSQLTAIESICRAGSNSQVCKM